MKNYVLVLFTALFAVSCSKKIEIKGKVTGGSPLERIEFVEASGVATLPLANFGVSPTGEFSGSFEAPKNGMYLMTYAGKQNLFYLKQGQTFSISGNSNDFPQNFTITGDAKNNNKFLKMCQTFFEKYSQKVNMNELVAKDEATYLKEADKITADLTKNIDENAKNAGADSDVVSWKKDELNASILGFLNQFETYHGQTTNNPAFKVSQKFIDYEKKLSKDNDRLVENLPSYRNFLLQKISPEYQKFADSQPKKDGITTSEVFSSFLKTKKEMSQITKDYLLAYVMAQTDMNVGTTKEIKARITKLIDSDIQNATIKKGLKDIDFVVTGFPEGSTLPEASFSTQDGKKYSFAESKGKPTLVMFYASWNPYIAQSTIPVLKEVVNFYKSKMNFVFVNLDDTKEQFQKTSKELLKGIPGTKVYAEGGLDSETAKKFGIYAFKLPNFMLLDKDGKTAGNYSVNLGDANFIVVMDKLTGLKAPQVAPETPLPNQMIPAQPAPQQAPPQQPAQPQPAK